MGPRPPWAGGYLCIARSWRAHVKFGVAGPFSVPAAPFGQNPIGLRKLGSEQVKEGGARDQGQQRQVLLQLVQPGDGDDAIGVQQPMAEQHHQPLLLSDKVFERLRKGEGEGRGGQVFSNLPAEREQ